MRPNTSNSSENQEDDAVWRLLDASPRREANPTFLQDTLRRARLAESEKPSAWWQKIFNPRPLVGGALAASAALAMIFTFNSSEIVTSPDIADVPIAKPEPALAVAEKNDLSALQDEFSDELLLTAAENPDLFSDSEILAFLE